MVFLVVAVLLGGCVGSDAPDPDATPGSLRSLITPGQPRWRALAEAPAPRQEVAAAEVAGKVYVIGGLDGSGATDRVDVYDIAADKWTAGPPLPVKVHHAMAATFLGGVLAIGGYDAANKPSNQVFLLSNGTTWTPMPPLSRPRAAGAAVVALGRLFVLGGQSDGALAAPVEEFVPGGGGGAWEDRAAIPTTRHHIGAAFDGTWIYVSAGRRPAGGGGPDRNVGNFERYNPATNTWEKLPNVPTIRSGHGSGFVDGQVIVTGGEDPTQGGQPSIASTEAYDPVKRIWLSTLPGMFRARHGVAAIAIDDNLYVFLGGSRAALAPTADSDVLVIP